MMVDGTWKGKTTLPVTGRIEKNRFTGKNKGIKNKYS
jgi:hypothetical protein